MPAWLSTIVPSQSKIEELHSSSVLPNFFSSKPSVLQGRPHVRRQRRGDVDRLAGDRMRNDQAARVQVQLLLDVLRGHVDVALVLVVADDRVADHVHMRAQLVLTARDRLQRHPRRLLRRRDR